MQDDGWGIPMQPGDAESTLDIGQSAACPGAFQSGPRQESRSPSATPLFASSTGRGGSRAGKRAVHLTELCYEVMFSSCSNPCLAG